MSDIMQLASEALMRSEIKGYKVDLFMVTVADWNEFADAQHHVVKDPSSTTNMLMGVPVELFARVLDCVHRSVELAINGRVGWILNLDPLSKIEMRPAFDAEGFDP